VYEMYQWDQPDSAAAGNGRESVNGSPHPARARMHRARAGGRPGRAGTGRPRPAAQAVQVALDRRDNGGDPGTPRDQ
jgi:hypothetical protein